VAWLRFAVFTAVSLSFATSATAQVPPPPMLPEQTSIAENLVRAFSTKDEARYAALLADDVQVFEDGQNVARNKADWLKAFGPKLSATGVSFKLVPGYASTGRLLFIEYFNSLGSWGRKPPPDCCWGYDAVAYDIAGGKITVIRRLGGGTSRLAYDGKIAGK
jgi:hypothetical protein